MTAIYYYSHHYLLLRLSLLLLLHCLVYDVLSAATANLFFQPSQAPRHLQGVFSRQPKEQPDSQHLHLQRLSSLAQHSSLLISSILL